MNKLDRLHISILVVALAVVAYVFVDVAQTRAANRTLMASPKTVEAAGLTTQINTTEIIQAKVHEWSASRSDVISHKGDGTGVAIYLNESFELKISEGKSTFKLLKINNGFVAESSQAGQCIVLGIETAASPFDESFRHTSDWSESVVPIIVQSTLEDINFYIRKDEKKPDTYYIDAVPISFTASNIPVKKPLDEGQGVDPQISDHSVFWLALQQ